MSQSSRYVGFKISISSRWLKNNAPAAIRFVGGSLLDQVYHTRALKSWAKYCHLVAVWLLLRFCSIKAHSLTAWTTKLNSQGSPASNCASSGKPL
jgi:hypothetical protein